MNIRVPGKIQDLKEITYLGQCKNCKAIVEYSFSDLHLRGTDAPDTHELRCPVCKVREIQIWKSGTANHEVLLREVTVYEANLGTDNGR